MVGLAGAVRGGGGGRGGVGGESVLNDDVHTEPSRTTTTAAPSTPTVTTTAALSTPTRRETHHLPCTPNASPSTTSRKRTRSVVDDDNCDGEQKAARTNGNTAPGARRASDDAAAGGANEMPTPQNESRAFKEEPFPTMFSTPGSSIVGGPSQYWKEPVTPASSFETFGTPTPTWYRDAGLSLTSDDGLVGHISALLLRDRGVALDDHTKKALGGLLRRANRAKDAKVTEASHHIKTLEAELKVKDAKITECLHRITTLEAELEDAELPEQDNGI
ncbi:hypothetical protein BCR34DRAFT_644424 [Clohesyomyces aquaticus]|uniref:Uncharacterized protein n=1 Tax=Clohesyomyces aquaticus TaxID=1231657 RepID=A0A1Y1YBJ9_9PLEO|nr:hypothetical protein BCR34DRAFT_644424 [Clohesyomyces aquaticus]